MEKIVRFPDLAIIEAEAAAWLVRLQGESVSPDEREAFRVWQSQSALHRDALARLGAVWAEFDALRDVAGSLEDVAGIASPKAFVPQRRRHGPRLVTALAGLAAVLVVAIGLTLGIVTSHKTEVRHYQTGIGMQRTVSLVDGSSVLLNTDSQLDVRLTRERREVHLIRGEAYFEVARDKSRPFLVFAGQHAVRAVGTAFAVRLSDTSVEVTVTKGEVELTAQPPTATAPSAQPDEPVRMGLLAAGQTAVVNRTIEELKIVADAELNRKLAWRHGFIVFSDETLAQVIDDVSRYTNLTIEIQDPKLSTMRISGYFQVGKVDALLDALEKNFDLRIVRVNTSLVQLSAPS